MSESCFNCKNTKFDQNTVSLLCAKTKSGAHKQLTFYFLIRKYFCRHLHSSLISMLQHFRKLFFSPFTLTREQKLLDSNPRPLDNEVNVLHLCCYNPALVRLIFTDQTFGLYHKCFKIVNYDCKLRFSLERNLGLLLAPSS